MSYQERDWENTGTKVTKEDFKRMETGIKNNDKAIATLNKSVSNQEQDISTLKASPNFIGRPTVQNKEVAITETIEFESDLLNGWVAYSGFDSPKLIVSGKMATLSGVIKSGTTDSGTDILNIPSGYRPASTVIGYGMYCSSSGSPVFCRLNVMAGGRFAIGGIGANASYMAFTVAYEIA